MILKLMMALLALNPNNMPQADCLSFHRSCIVNSDCCSNKCIAKPNRKGYFCDISPPGERCNKDDDCQKGSCKAPDPNGNNDDTRC